MYKLSKDTELTPELIKKLINKHKFEEVPRMEKLFKYYDAKNEAIMMKHNEDESLPCNKVAHPYASYITDTLTGYFMGDGVSYSSVNDEAGVDELRMILEYSDEQDENVELAKQASIFGLGVEMLYIDEDGMTRIKYVDPREVILIYEDTLEELLIGAIRYYKVYDYLQEHYFYKIEVYTDKEIRLYHADELLSSLVLDNTIANHFNQCPFVVYQNNSDERGDFEKVISLIDAYDKMESDSLDDFDYFVDAYLALTGLNADASDIAEMKKNRVLLLDQDSDAKWLTKDGDSSGADANKTRIDKDIHKFSQTPDMSDEAFAGNASGVAIKYKTMPMENLVAVKERKFKKGLQRRIELIFDILAIKGSAHDWRAIDITFTRNLPTNETEIANMVSTLDNIVSNKTLLAQLPFVENVDDELDRLKTQKEENMAAFYNESENFLDNGDEEE